MERRQGVYSELSDIIGGVVQQKFKKVLAEEGEEITGYNLQIVEIQKGLSLFCFAKVQQIPDIECVFA